jgi:radical SAM protein with 4Fe4S-binding SPASM domain
MSIPKDEREFISSVTKMEFPLFKKCIDDIEKFPQKVKVIRFVGMGEPLLHPHLTDMIHYADESDKFERIELITNGSLLTPSVSTQLVNSGLTKLLVSIQGTSELKYQEISQFPISIDLLIKNLGFFYTYSRFGDRCKIHIKIADCALDDDNDYQKFLALFGDVCDTIGIERIGPIHPGVKYNEELQTTNINQYGEEFDPTEICSQPFYMMQINPDGNVVPCFAVPYPEILGDCNTESVVDIWNGKKYNNFRRCMLEGMDNKSNSVVCNKCEIFKHRTHMSDDLKSQVQRLKSYYINLDLYRTNIRWLNEYFNSIYAR